MSKRNITIVTLVLVCVVIFGGWIILRTKFGGERYPSAFVNFESDEFGLAFTYPSEWGETRVEKYEGGLFSISFSGEDGYDVRLWGDPPNYNHDGPDFTCDRYKDREVKPGVFLSYDIIKLGDAVPMGVINATISEKYPTLCATLNVSRFLHSFEGGWGGYFANKDFNEETLKSFLSFEQNSIRGFERLAETIRVY